MYGNTNYGTTCLWLAQEQLQQPVLSNGKKSLVPFWQKPFFFQIYACRNKSWVWLSLVLSTQQFQKYFILIIDSRGKLGHLIYAHLLHVQCQVGRVQLKKSIKVHLNYSLESSGTEEDLGLCLNYYVTIPVSCLAKRASQTPRGISKWVRAWIVLVFLHSYTTVQEPLCSHVQILSLERM